MWGSKCRQRQLRHGGQGSLTSSRRSSMHGSRSSTWACSSRRPESRQRRLCSGRHWRRVPPLPRRSVQHSSRRHCTLRSSTRTSMPCCMPCWPRSRSSAAARQSRRRCSSVATCCSCTRCSSTCCSSSRPRPAASGPARTRVRSLGLALGLPACLLPTRRQPRPACLARLCAAAHLLPRALLRAAQCFPAERANCMTGTESPQRQPWQQAAGSGTWRGAAAHGPSLTASVSICRPLDGPTPWHPPDPLHTPLPWACLPCSPHEL